MRKKTILLLIDRLLWIFICLLPLLYLLVSPLGYSVGGGTEGSIDLPTLTDILDTLGINNSNFIYTTMDDLFGSAGIVPLFTSDSAMLYYFTYFIIIEILHLLVDFIVFIPRLSHKWLNYLTRADEVD